MIRAIAIRFALAACFYPVNIKAQTVPPADNPEIHSIAGAVSAARIEADIRRLVAFGTRNTLSDTVSQTRGIGAARRWIKSEFENISAQCGGCLEVFYVSRLFDIGRDNPPTNVVSVVAIQRGRTDPNRVVIMSGDIDSRVSNTLNAVDSSPGANDNASGMAGTIEAARVLTKYQFNGSIAYLALAGEEQGLMGGAAVADYARENGWNIEAMLNNDMIGNIQGISGVIENQTARVFSDPTPMSAERREQLDAIIDQIRQLLNAPASADRNENAEELLGQVSNLAEAQWSQMRRRGGEVDGNSRQLARYVDRMADLYLPHLDVMMIYRLDRFGRGGHHTPFANLGWPAVRIMETNENYTRQHQNIRDENGIHYGDVIEGVDFVYAAKLTALNAVTLASLAKAPGTPQQVRITGAVQASAILLWEAPSDEPNVTGYRVYWRSTTSPTWDHSLWVGKPTTFEGRPTRGVTPETLGHRFDGLVIDNYFFGVAAVAADGSESTVVFPLPN